MNPIDRFYAYLGSLEQRLRWKAWAAGAAAVAVAAFLGTLGGAWLADRYAFSDASLFWARLALFLCVALALAFGLILPWLRVNQRRAAAAAERKHPEFEQRVTTLVQSEGVNPFHALLAEEALERAERFPASRLVEPRTLLGLSLAGALGAGALVWLTMAGPGALGHGAALLWAGAPKGEAEGYYRIVLQPGDRRVRRGSDQVVEAQLVGFEAPEVRLLARPTGASKWESVVMEQKEGVAGGYGFLLAGLLESMEYKVEAGRVRSHAHLLTVVDLPAVRRIDVTYHFPSWLGLKSVREEAGGDLRAVEGSEAELAIETDRPLRQGLLVLDEGTRIPLTTRDGNVSVARVPIKRDGLYYVAAIDEGETVRISDDYFIEARPETPPVVKILRPGRDARVNPIEEVPIEVEATDDYGLHDLQLHYSVNGGPEKTVPLMKQRGSRDARGSALIALEDYNLEPGDLVALYATARDARAIARTDMMFIEAQPFEKEFSQSQTMGGGGDMEGGRQTNISTRQKEIISATWNQIRSRKPASVMKEDAEFLAGVQKKLSEQALSLSKRMQSRELSGTNEEFQKFSKEMEQSSKAMNEASDLLKGLRWRDALAPEQKALQHLLRAESMFRQIQVAFGQRGGGGGGGGGGESRDLESLFDLELDTEKNQYETADRGGGGGSQREREVDEAVKRLEELAKRQQQLAEQQRQQRQQSFQQRWAQEMLRREAEELRRQMESLSRGESPQSSQQSSSQQGEQSSQSPGQSQGSSSKPQSGQTRSLREMASGRGATDPRLERAMKEVERALDDIRRSQQSQAQGGGEGDPDSARRAAERMNEARELLGGMRRQETGSQMDSISQRAGELARRQRDFENRLKEAYGSSSSGRQMPGQTQSREQAEKFADEKQRMQRDYERLEKDMKEATRSMANSERAASSKLRDALGEAQQNEIGLRMKFSSEWIRRGMGNYMAPRERVVTEALDRLQQQVEEAQQAMGQRGGEGQERAERALEQLERARDALNRQMGQAGRGQADRGGQQQGQQQGGQQRGGQQPGDQQRGGQQGQRGEQKGDATGARQQGSDGQRRTDYGALNDGSLGGPMSGSPLESGRFGGADQRAIERAYGDALRQLEQLRASGAASDETQKELESLLQRMQRLDPKRFPGNPQLLETLRRSILPELEQLELRLRRQLGGSQDVRAGETSKVPAGYEKAVAEYFKRLSKGN